MFPFCRGIKAEREIMLLAKVLTMCDERLDFMAAI